MSSYNGKQRLITLISLTLTVASFSAAAGCNLNEVSLLSCTPPPPQGCQIRPDIGCEDTPPPQDPQSHEALYRFLREMDSDLLSNINVVPRAPSNKLFATCSSTYADQLAYAKADIAPYIANKPQFINPFWYVRLVVTYSNGQHGIWEVLNDGNGTPYEWLGDYNRPWLSLGNNSAGYRVLTSPAGITDPAPTCGN